MFKLLMGLVIFFLFICILFFGLRFIFLCVADLFRFKSQQGESPINEEYKLSQDKMPVKLARISANHELKIYDPVSNHDTTIEASIQRCFSQHDRVYITLDIPQTGEEKTVALSHIRHVHNLVTNENYYTGKEIEVYFSRFF